MEKFVIDGIFLEKRITGIQRYALEITKELDKLVTTENIQLLVPSNYTGKFALKNIPIIKYGERKGRLWEQIDFPRYLKEKGAQGIFFENTIPLFYRHGIVTIHDISLRVNPKLFLNSLHNLVSVLWRRIIYWAVANSQMKIVTVSNFSKSEIEQYYHISSNRISVVYSAWQHMNEIKEDETVLVKNPLIEEGKYFFAMSSMATNKNFMWIAHAAEQNPKETFVIAGGGKIKEVINNEYSKLDNLIYLGYVSDEEAKALMKNCKAFLFPSFYEGFGLPPLEAVAAGAKAIVISDTECMHEIYGEDGTYINPYDYKINMKNIRLHIVNKERLLTKYSWNKSAENFFELTKRM